MSEADLSAAILAVVDGVPPLRVRRDRRLWSPSPVSPSDVEIDDGLELGEWSDWSL